MNRDGEPADRWSQIDELFGNALDLPESERADWLRVRCAGDRDLEREIESLLANAVASAAVLRTGAAGAIGDALENALKGDDLDAQNKQNDRVGSLVGPYRLVELIGRGGMADVYLGEREGESFEQRVAVKIQRRGLDTEDLLTRFRAERQILSSLNHPNIARLIDGGATEDGAPYLVMEYVDGSPITDHCERNSLPVKARLELFRQAARAVQSAHVRLVVHRDLKPSNILVSDEGVVKLLDFGIAKLLDPTTMSGDTPRTRTGFRPLTPEYASPEQVSGQPITTASDVYQLGLVLYRLLTGGQPYTTSEDRRSLEEAITETRPTRPSAYVGMHEMAIKADLGREQLTRRLRGDLDTIILKALRKEPNRRYVSVSEMAEDVRRHLEGFPISARQDSRAYRVRKFLRRNPWVAPVTVGMVGAVGLYVGTLIQHGHQMEEERNVARLEAAKATATQDFLVGLFRSADPFSSVPDSRQDILVTEIMEVGVGRARTEFADEPQLQALTLGTIGDVFLGLGDPERAQSLRNEAYQVAVTAFGYESPQAAVGLRQLVEPTIHNERRGAGMADSAVSVAIRAVDAARRTFGENHLETARAEIALARAHLFSRSFYAAEPTLMHVIRKLRQSDWEATDELAEALMTLGRVLTSTGTDRWPEAAAAGREAIEIYERTYGSDHVRTWAARVWLARTMNDPDEARRVLEEAIAAFEEQLGRTHEMTIRASQALATHLASQGEFDDAAAAYRSTLDRRAERSGAQGFWYWVNSRGLGDALFQAGRFVEAAAAYREAADVAEADGNVVEGNLIRSRRAWSLLKVGDLVEGLAVARRAHETILREGVVSPWQDDRCVLARALRAIGQEGSADSVAALAATAMHPDFRARLAAEQPCFGVLPEG